MKIADIHNSTEGTHGVIRFSKNDQLRNAGIAQKLAANMTRTIFEVDNIREGRRKVKCITTIKISLI